MQYPSNFSPVKLLCYMVDVMHITIHVDDRIMIPSKIQKMVYRIAGKFGGGKVWQIDSF